MCRYSWPIVVVVALLMNIKEPSKIHTYTYIFSSFTSSFLVSFILYKHTHTESISPITPSIPLEQHTYTSTHIHASYYLHTHTHTHFINQTLCSTTLVSLSFFRNDLAISHPIAILDNITSLRTPANGFTACNVMLDLAHATDMNGTFKYVQQPEDAENNNCSLLHAANRNNPILSQWNSTYTFLWSN